MIFTYLTSLKFDCYDPLLQMYQAVASLQPADTPPTVFSLSQQLGKELWLDGPTFSLLFNYKDKWLPFSSSDQHKKFEFRCQVLLIWR